MAMDKIHKYPNLRYCPIELSDDDYFALDELGELLEMNFIHAITVASQNLHLPEVFEMLIDHFSYDEDIENEDFWIEKFYETHPDNINAKIAFITLKFGDLSIKSNITYTKRVLKPEIECLLNHKTLEKIYSDEEYSELLFFLTRFFHQIDEKKNARTIFQYVLSFGDREIINSLAFIISDQELDEELQEAYLSSQAFMEDDIFFWLEDMLAEFGEKKSTTSPHYELAYVLLNKPSFIFNDDDFRLLKNKIQQAKLISDLYWVLANGFRRALTSENKHTPYFLTNVLYTAAHYELKEMLPDFLAILILTPNDYLKTLFPQYYGTAFTFPIIRLSASDLGEYEKNYTSTFTSPIVQNMIAEILCGIAVLNLPTSKKAQSLIKKYWKDCSKNHFEYLACWIKNIKTYGIEGYEAYISEAIEQGAIDKMFYLQFIETLKTDQSLINLKSIKSSPMSIEFYFNQHKKLVTADLQNSIQNLDAFLDLTMENFFNDIEEFMLNPENKFEDEDDLEDEDFDDQEFFEKEHSSTDVFDAFLIYEPGSKNEDIQTRDDPCPCGSGKEYKSCCWNMN